MRKGGGAVERMQGEGRVKPGGGCRAVFMDEEAKSGDTKDSNGLVG